MALVGLSWRDIFAYPQMLPYKRRALTCLSSSLDSHSGEIEIELAAASEEAEAVRAGEETRDERRRREEDEEEDEEDEEDEDEDETSAVSKGFQFDGISIRSISINSATFAPRIELSCINLVSFQLCNCVYLRANPSNPQHQA